MSKRDTFWKSIWLADNETVAWPSEASKRGQLASQIAGAAVVGAVEHVLGESLDRLAGQPPASGSDNYQARSRDVQVLSTLSDEQRAAVTRLVRETAYSSVYWPMVKMRNPPGIVVRLVAARSGQEDTSEEAFDLTDFLDPHQLFLQWVDEFGEFLDPQAPLDARWKDLELGDVEPEASEERVPFVGELVEGRVVFSGPNLVLVRVGDRNVTVRVRIEVAKGEAVRLGLSPEGQPRVIQVRGLRINVS